MGMKYPTMEWGKMEAVVNKLGGMEGVERFLRDELVVKPVEMIFKIWKTIKIGTLKDVHEIRRSFERNHKMGFNARFVIDNMKISETEEEVNLVVASAKELGFKSGAVYADICERALELGLDLCPDEILPQ